MIFKFIILLYCCFVASFVSCSENADVYNKESLEIMTKNIQDEFSNQYMNYIKTGEKSSTLKDLMKQLTFPMETGVPEIDRLVQPRDAEICMQCRALIQVILDLRRSGIPDEILKSTVIEVCWTMEIQLPHVCEGFVNLNFDAVAYIIDNNPDLSADQACGIVRQAANCDIQNPLPDWSINIDPNGPAGNGPKSDTPTPSQNDITVLQLTDIHFDPNYLENTNAVCLQPACCRRAQGIADFPEYGAGRWGDYRDCDSPWETLEDMFFQIRETHRNIDYIYFTGDIVDHGTWETSFAENAQAIMRVMNSFKQIFPNIPVFPILGNHEAHPTNLISPGYMTAENHPLSTKWLYDLVAEEWNFWLPDDTKETILQGGYYTVLIRPGFRIIALNNNDCFTFNYWLMLTSAHSASQLQWLHDTLLMAETNNEKVHIIAHVPSGYGSCFTIWAREYRRIVQRFWNTISGQFNGHTHRDQFTVFYSDDNNNMNPINVAWNGGGATTFSLVNSNYRLYSIETDTYNIDYIYLTGDIIDHGVWETSFAVNVQGIMRTMVFLRQMFPNIPVFPILGNHEAHPVNLMAPEHLSTINHPLSTQWLYDLSAEEWNFWLPDDTKETILKGGYYTVLVRPGFRIIALNNNDCFIFNLWLMLTSEQSIPQLQWLHDTLLMAESNNEKVHILKHIPTGNGECLAIWEREFNRIVQRFWNTISGQFNGHTHHDEFTVYYSTAEPSNAVNVAWNGGSATSYSNVNSNYRLYSVETNTYQITDHETWIFNLTAANLNRNQRPEWFKEYSFMNAYGINNLSPNALDDLLVDFANNPEKLHLFWEHAVKMGDPMLALGCDNYCLANELCVIATSVFGQTERCDQLLEIFWNNIKK